ncbi:MAG TPA: hypothetical protein VN025_02980 [Candidatus Dormibacteraeota bacterium]|nr:hypothetical protein [Candidatus Dormibacteraeota bacterium]
MREKLFLGGPLENRTSVELAAKSWIAIAACGISVEGEFVFTEKPGLLKMATPVSASWQGLFFAPNTEDSPWPDIP